MFQEFIQKHNLADFRLKQLYKAYYQEFITQAHDISTLPKDVRNLLKEEIDFEVLQVQKEMISQDGSTTKVLFSSNSTKAQFETVLMDHQDRNTVCVSCMQGCPVGCVFCATGQMKQVKLLDANEIVAQVLYFARKLQKQNEKISNVVFMGMGEPMLNFDNVYQAYLILTSPQKFGLSKRRITISTSGYIKGIKKLVELGYKGRLAISLHAPNQEIRDELMPNVSKLNKYKDLIEALDEFMQSTNKRVSLEYIMIKDINDKEIHANELVTIFKDKLVHFNLIPYNPVPFSNYKRSSSKIIDKFAQILSQAQIPVSIRSTMGDDIQAACGQLVISK